MTEKHTQLLADVDSRVAELNRLLSFQPSASGVSLANRRNFFRILAGLKDLSNGIIDSYCALQFSTSTRPELVKFIFDERLTITRSLVKIRAAGVLHFYFSNRQATCAALAELGSFTNCVSSFRAGARSL